MRPLLLCALSLFLLTAFSPEPLPYLRFRAGKDHAILFAVNDYKNLPDLSNPITNAQQIAAELKSRWGFADPQVIQNPTAAQIEQVLSDYANRFARNLNGQYPATGQLFIFFSGHGTERLENGYFLPADADQNNLRQTGLAYSYLRPLINEINCQHILVAVDACYSLSFDENYKKKPDFQFRRPGELNENDKILVNHERYKARVFYTSDAIGDMTPDKSSFAKKLLEGLRTYTPQSGFMTSSELFANYVQKASPTPHGGEFGGDEAGSTFLFFSNLPKPSFDPMQDVRAWTDAKNAHTLEAYRGYLRNFPQGEFRELAESRAKTLEQQNNEYNRWLVAKQANTRAAYEQYLRENPSGAYRELAEDALQRLAPPVSSNMILIPGGSFQMGDVMGDNEYTNETVHTVSLNSFYLAKNELTFDEYDAFCRATSRELPADQGWGRGQRPVIKVSWYDAIEYCNWRSGQEGLQAVYSINKNSQDANNSNSNDTQKWTISYNRSANGYRLPTEAEWEYAARAGGRKVRFGNGKDVADPREINFDASSGGKKTYSVTGEYRQKTVPAGSLNSPNPLGLHDMSGNVWEWCWDYLGTAQNNPTGPTHGVSRIIRGGSWEDDPISVRVAYRFEGEVALRNRPPSGSHNALGFRLARQQ